MLLFSVFLFFVLCMCILTYSHIHTAVLFSIDGKSSFSLSESLDFSLSFAEALDPAPMVNRVIPKPKSDGKQTATSKTDCEMLLPHPRGGFLKELRKFFCRFGFARRLELANYGSIYVYLAAPRLSARSPVLQKVSEI